MLHHRRTHHRRTAHLLLAVLCAAAVGGCSGTVPGVASPAEAPATAPAVPPAGGTDAGTDAGTVGAGDACGLLQPGEVSAVLDANTSSSFPVPDASMCTWISDDASGRSILLLVSAPGVPVDPSALDAFGSLGSLGSLGTDGTTSSGSLGFEGNGRGGYLVVVTTDPAGGAAVAQRLVDLIEPRL